MTANQAIHYVREWRPKSVQMNDQIQSLTEFENYLRPLRIVFPRVSSINTNLAKLNESGDDKSAKLQQQDKLVDYTCNLNTFLNRQRLILHGAEGKTLKYIPKIIYVCGEQLRKLAFKWKTDGIDSRRLQQIQKLSNEFSKDILETAR